MTEYKVVVLGDGGVGKTALTIQCVSNHFVEYYDPTIESAYRRQVVIDEEACLLDILDTAGQEEFSALRAQWIRSGEGFVLIYAVTSRSSFEQVDMLRQKILQAKDQDKVPMVLVGNKCDLESERQVTTMEGKELAKMWNCPFYEASAFNRHNVDEAFFQAVREIRLVKEPAKKDGKPTKKEKMKKKLEAKGCMIL